MDCAEILKRLKSLSNPKNVEGMARFGINPDRTYGVQIPVLRQIAKKTGKDHALAQELWASGIHEARILASMVDSPSLVTEEQMESWVREFDSWDVCDGCIMNLFAFTPFAWDKTVEWSSAKKEFVKRAGFVMMARLAVGSVKAEDGMYEKFLPIIKRESGDGRNFVRKAVNWALRQIGKRNVNLNKKAIKTAREIQKIDSKAAKWVASDALRELQGNDAQKRLKLGVTFLRRV